MQRNFEQIQQSRYQLKNDCRKQVFQDEFICIFFRVIVSAVIYHKNYPCIGRPDKILE